MRHLSHRLARGAAAFVIVGICASTLSGAITSTGDTVIGESIEVGLTGAGTYLIDGGSSAFASSLTAGRETTGNGKVTITGNGSRLTLTNLFIDIGASGIGWLEILDGASVQAGTLRIGVDDLAKGTVIVDGEGSVLNLFNSLRIESGNTPRLLRISNGGAVSANSTSTEISASAIIELDRGTLRIRSFENFGTVTGSGEIMVTGQSFATGNHGLVQANEDDILSFTGVLEFDNTGTIAVEGGEIAFNASVRNEASGSIIRLNEGVLRVGTANSGELRLINMALVTSTGGQNDLYGRVSNLATGQISVANTSVLTFHEHVDVTAGTLSVHPGSKAVFPDNVTLHAGSTLVTDLVSTNPETGIGQIEVAGTAQLAGTLNATQSNSFTPQLGESFTLISASTITGSLSLGVMPPLAIGSKWDLDVISNQLILSVVPGLAGEYNSNGVVDAADYVVWRKSLGQTGQDLAADGDSNGIINNNDYNFWRARYSHAIPGGSGMAAVPEPAAVALLVMAIGFLCRIRRRVEKWQAVNWHRHLSPSRTIVREAAPLRA